MQLNYNKTYSATSFSSFWKVELSITYMMPLANKYIKPYQHTVGFTFFITCLFVCLTCWTSHTRLTWTL